MKFFFIICSLFSVFSMVSCLSRREAIREELDIEINRRIEQYADEWREKRRAVVDISMLDGTLYVIDTELDTSGRKKREIRKVFDFTKKDSVNSVVESLDSVVVVDVIDEDAALDKDTEVDKKSSSFWDVTNVVLDVIIILVLVIYALYYFLTKRGGTSVTS